jgi:hypothetical protein
MKLVHSPVEITGNIIVHHPVEAEVIQYQPWFAKEWEQIVFVSDHEMEDVINLRSYFDKMLTIMDEEQAA